MLKVAKKKIKTLSVGNDDVGCFLVKRACSGFTLLELTLVIFFMALIAGLTTPFVMSTLDRMELKTSAHQIVSALRYARSEAITIKQPVVFNGDLSNNKFWVTPAYENGIHRIVSLKKPVQLDHFLNEYKKEIFHDGEFTITFFPQGNSSGGVIGMGIEKSRESGNYYVCRHRSNYRKNKT